MTSAHSPPDTLVELDQNSPGIAARREELHRQAMALLQSAYLLFERDSYGHTPSAER